MLPKARTTILVATDFSPASRGAFDEGVRLARQTGGRLLLVHAIRPLGAPGLELTRPDTTKEENETAEPVPGMGLAGSEWAELAQAHGVDCDIVVRPGLPASVILEEADRVDAHTIVLGSHGKQGLSYMVLGSVAEDVRAGCDREVLVIGEDRQVQSSSSEPHEGAGRPPRPAERSRVERGVSHEASLGEPLRDR